MDKNAKIFVAGHRGMVGSAIVRRLQAAGYANVITRSRSELNLLDQAAVHAFLAEQKPDYLFIAAAKVGGIQANNTYRADFLYQNLVIEANLIHGAHLAGTQALMFLGSSCIYPKLAPQPLNEDCLLTGPLEPTNEPYAIAKIAGIKLCEAYNHQYGRQYVSVMPTNLYGINDNYDLNNSHVLPALIRRFHEARASDAPSVTIWGTGLARREFLYVDDMARACVHVMDLSKATYTANTESMESHVNVGTGEDLPILELAHLVKDIIGYRGAIETDPSKPDGSPRKLLDVSRLKALGWAPETDFVTGIKLAYADFLQRESDGGHPSHSSHGRSSATPVTA